ncbi:MAG: FHA domain-containing protein [Anaerolineaceae bacterium]|nr:FHA domain-containing protein [Anaerolineaceae bacterium]
MSAILVLILRVLLAAALYTFLGWALVTVWRELKANSDMISSKQIPAISLLRVDTGTQTSQEFDCAEVVIGRDPGCEFSIPHETVSAHHARLSYHHKQWWLEDLHSTNGTFLNDERVLIPTVMMTGDELRCGQIYLQIVINGKS